MKSVLEMWIFLVSSQVKTEVLFRLQEIIENINETLEELKYHTAEIQGELEEEESPPDH